MITIPAPTQDEIDHRFDLAVKLHKEHLLSKTGKMYPFNPDNLLEAIAEMNYEQKIVFGARAEYAIGEKYYSDEQAALGEFICRISNEYWTKCAEKESLFVVQKNFDPLNMR